MRTGEVEWLADAGFGRGCFDEPIHLVPEVAQVDSAGYLRAPARSGRLARPALRRRGAVPPDAPEHGRSPSSSRAVRYHQSSPDSPFTRGTVCTIRTPDGRVTLAGTRLVETGATGRQERELDRAGFAAVLAGRFGIRLDDAGIARLAALGASPVAAAL